MLLTLAIGILTLIFGAVFKLAGRTSWTMIVGLSVVAFCVSEMFATHIIISHQNRQTRDVAETVVFALDNYFEANRCYPDALEALVPDYLPSVPNTALGWHRRSFYYHKSADDRFSISYDYPFFMYCRFNSDSRVWFCDD